MRDIAHRLRHRAEKRKNARCVEAGAADHIEDLRAKLIAAQAEANRLRADRDSAEREITRLGEVIDQMDAQLRQAGISAHA